MRWSATARRHRFTPNGNANQRNNIVGRLTLDGPRRGGGFFAFFNDDMHLHWATVVPVTQSNSG